MTRLAFLWDNDPIPRFSPDRRVSVFSDYAQPLQLTDLTTNQRIPGTPRHDGVITAAAFSPDSRRIVTGGSEGTARMWDVATGALRARRCGIRGWFPSSSTVPVGPFILTAAGATAELWNDAGRLEMVMPHAGEVAAAAFSADGRAILTATKEGTAFLWSVEDRRTVPREITYAGWDHVRLMVLSPDARFVLTQWIPERRLLGFRPTPSGATEMVTQREGETRAAPSVLGGCIRPAALGSGALRTGSRAGRLQRRRLAGRHDRQVRRGALLGNEDRQGAWRALPGQRAPRRRL